MESKRLHIPANIPLTRLQTEQASDIEVPAGTHHFHLEQGASEEQSYTFHLRKPGTTLFVSGVVTGSHTHTPHLTLQIRHHAPHTRAETLVRTLAKDQSQARFSGTLIIEKGAYGAESYLNHHSLLLDSAKSWSWPALEIQNDEVKCSHAATFRTITEKDIFYLRSRGLSREVASNLIIESFLADAQS